MNSSNKKIKVAVDLFAGGGGLSLGLKKAGFLVSAAVEIEPAACATYQANHPGTVLFQQDIRQLTGVEVLRTSPTGKIDLIAACPPCQGFSSLTSKYKKSDPRNELIFEFVRLVLEIKPSAIMMENVPGLANKGAPIFDVAMQQLRDGGYSLKQEIVNVANYGVPQSRRRLVVLGALGSEIEIPQPTHSENPEKGLLPWVTVRDAIADLPRPTTLASAMVKGGPIAFDWHVVRSLSEENLARLRATKSGKSRFDLPENLRPKCHRGKETGFSNVYGRMTWDMPSPTITGGCTTLSKGRFGHPSLLRTISVREAALLQTFPADYKFSTEQMEKVCNIVGNALPPIFAEKMAAACIRSI